MTDLNLEEKFRHYWQKAHDAVCSRDYKALNRAYWALNALEKQKLPVIEA